MHVVHAYAFIYTYMISHNQIYDSIYRIFLIQVNSRQQSSVDLILIFRSLRSLRLLDILNQSVQVIKQTMMGHSSSSRAFRGLARRWLTSMSFGCNGVSLTSRSSFTRLTTACVVSSWSSLMPLIRSLLRWLYCSGTSLCNYRWHTSPRSSSITASFWATSFLKVQISCWGWWNHLSAR